MMDVAIAGGGLAGLSLAIQCALKGRSVVLFEKETYPLHRVCGEYISLESKPFLQSLGIDIDEAVLPHINRLCLTDVAGREYRFALSLGGFGISRFELDEMLYRRAVAVGVQVYTGTRVTDLTFDNDVFTLHTAAGIFQSRLAACAFGKRSNLDIKWKRPFTQRSSGKLNNYIGVKYHIRHQHSRNEIVLHNFANGYCGMSAIEDGKSCLCYLTTADNLQQSGNSIAAMEEKVLFQNPRLKTLITQSERVFDSPVTIAQISFSPKQQVENHALMVGDAAGMITPLCGNGMSMALHASKIAFECIEGFLSGQYQRSEMEQRYVTAWKAHFARRLWMGRTVQRMFGGNISTALFLKAMQYLPPLAKAIIRSTHGQPF